MDSFHQPLGFGRGAMADTAMKANEVVAVFALTCALNAYAMMFVGGKDYPKEHLGAAVTITIYMLVSTIVGIVAVHYWK